MSTLIKYVNITQQFMHYFFFFSTLGKLNARHKRDDSLYIILFGNNIILRILLRLVLNA